jgi:hypothetical protein
VNRHGIDLLDYRIAHGLCIKSTNGDVYAHAWLEKVSTKICLDFGLLECGEKIVIEMPPSVFYSSRSVFDATLYTLPEASHLSRVSHTSGPWVHRYFIQTNDWQDQTMPNYFNTTEKIGYNFLKKKTGK